MEHYQLKSKNVLKIKPVAIKTGLAISTIYNKLNSSSPYADGTFPRPVRLGVSSIGFFESEIDTWLNSRPRAAESLTPKSSRFSLVKDPKPLVGKE